MQEGRKQAVSLRLSAADIRKIKKLAKRLEVRDSDVIRYALKVMLAKLAPLCDAAVRGRSLMPVFIDTGVDILQHFELDEERLETIINSGAKDEHRVDADDIQLMAMIGMQRNYAKLSLRDLHDKVAGEIRSRWLCAAIALVGVTQPAMAAAVQYVLDQSNETVLPDGVPRVGVTISDGVGGNIVFTVATLPGAFVPDTNFGLQSFGFNLASGAAALDASKFILPSGWSVSATSNQDGFGNFEWVVSGTGNNRLDPLTFSITNIAGDTPLSYFDLSSGTAGQGNVAFAAHVTDFEAGDVESAYVGGSTPVPVPAAAWLLGSGLLGLLGFARRRTAG